MGILRPPIAFGHNEPFPPANPDRREVQFDISERSTSCKTPSLAVYETFAAEMITYYDCHSKRKREGRWFVLSTYSEQDAKGGEMKIFLQEGGRGEGVPCQQQKIHIRISLSPW